MSTVDKVVIERIRKRSARAKHASADKNKYRTALIIAHKVIQEYSISQAELMKEKEDKTARAEKCDITVSSTQRM